MMRQLLAATTALVAIACIVACKKDMTAMTAAERYYECLMDSDFNEWIDGTAGSENMPDEVRQERIDLLRQYLHSEEAQRKGLRSAKALRDTIVDDNAFVFLELGYGDSTREEVLLPMVKVGEAWKMK